MELISRARKSLARLIIRLIQPHLDELFTIAIPYHHMGTTMQFVKSGYARPGDAAIDVYPPHDITIKPGKSVVIHTGIATRLPDWMWAEVKDRSSLASGLIYTHGGVIDPQYTGEYKIIIRNHREYAVTLYQDQACAQIVFQPKVFVKFYLADNLPSTTRGDGGFGSTT